MKAVNLIPADRRRSTGGVGRSGGAVYVVLGVLGGLLLLATLYAVANHQVADRKAQLVKATQDSATAQARAQQLAPYKQFSDLRAQREQAVSSLATTRFDWPTAMRNVASALPTGVVLSTFTGNPSGASANGGAPSSSPAPSPSSGSAAGSGPSVHLTGCATSHTQVGDVINRLRGVPGVTNVLFTSSTKSGGGSSTGAPSPGSNTGPCGPDGPVFDLSVYFGSVPAGSAAGGSAQPAPAAGAPAPTAAGGH